MGSSNKNNEPSTCMTKDVVWPEEGWTLPGLNAKSILHMDVVTCERSWFGSELRDDFTIKHGDGTDDDNLDDGKDNFE